MRRCSDRYNGHWCPVHGTCTCTIGDRSRRWDPIPHDDCPLHGVNAKHGKVKILRRKR